MFYITVSFRSFRTMSDKKKNLSYSINDLCDNVLCTETDGTIPVNVSNNVKANTQP